MNVVEKSDRILVTGGTGFLGSGFVRHAIDAGANVTVVARHGANHWRLGGVSGRYETRTGSLADLARADDDKRWSTMVHFAAAGVNQTFDDVEELVATNVGGTAQAVTFALRHGVRRFVLLGTSGEYGPGHDLSLHTSRSAPTRCPTREWCR
jgi:dTDP-glucose 4,6-dehydratase